MEIFCTVTSLPPISPISTTLNDDILHRDITNSYFSYQLNGDILHRYMTTSYFSYKRHVKWIYFAPLHNITNEYILYIKIDQYKTWKMLN